VIFRMIYEAGCGRAHRALPRLSSRAVAALLAGVVGATIVASVVLWSWSALLADDVLYKQGFYKLRASVASIGHPVIACNASGGSTASCDALLATYRCAGKALAVL